MCITRKPRTSYTDEEDVVALREVVGSNSAALFSGGSSRSKQQLWATAAQRVSALGVEVTGEGLRRHIADLVRKHRKEAGANIGKERMRWGMPWPKSETELERDRLIEEYVRLLEVAKQTPVVRKPPVKAVPAPAKAVLPPKTSLRMPRVPDPPAPSEMFDPPSRTFLQQKRPSPAVISFDDGDEEDDENVCSSLFVAEPVRQRSAESDVESSSKWELKRRRLDMEDRVHNRMLDIQTEQIKLQREQLHLQSEAMRSMAESTQAIARALHAMQHHRK